LIDIVDEDGDLDLAKGNIILFITESYFKKILEENPEKDEDEDEDEDEDKDKDKESKEEDASKKSDEDESDEDEASAVMKIKIPSHKISAASAQATETMNLGKNTIDSEIFIQNTKTKQPEKLIEETQEIANGIKKEFTPEVHDVWIQKFMKNKNYGIIDNEGGGDCFFAVIRDAFKQIGKETTVEKLRAILSKEATEEVFSSNRTLYLEFMGELKDKERALKELKKTMQVIKKRNEKAATVVEREMIMKEANELVELYKGLSEEKRITKQLLEEFDDLASVDSLEQFKEFIQTRNYWADTWAVSTMERLLNIKVVILSEEAYRAKDYDSVLKCGQLNDTDLERRGQFTPDFYIMTTYSGDHYKLITYKEKHIFKYPEIPYDIKVMVINKCLERNAGPYYIIKDFRDLKTKLGLNPNEGEPGEDGEDDDLNKDLYEPEIVFMFHAHSNAGPKAGDGSGEKIARSRMSEFNVLNKIKEWRKKLDDSWTAPFTIDHHRFNTVEHYKLGSQFKKGFPDFYLQFSTDSNSDISKDLTLAKIAGSKSGKTKDKVLRDRKIKIDADYDDRIINPRKDEERRIALHAKFTQNQDLSQVLRETKMAKLVHFVRSQEPEIDLLLMKVRKDIK
jgi:hypothetical protein